MEITHEKTGLPKEKQYFSWRIHCNSDEFDSGLFESTMGIVDMICTDTFSQDIYRKMIQWAMRFGETIRTEEKSGVPKKYTLHYKECYEKEYEIEPGAANSLIDAKKLLLERIRTGEENGPEECCDSWFDDNGSEVTYVCPKCGHELGKDTASCPECGWGKETRS